MMFTATPVSEEAADGVHTKPVTFRAQVSLVNRWVEYVVLLTPADLLAFDRSKFVWIWEDVSMKKPDKILIKELREGSILYDGDSTSCDCNTMNILKECTDLAIEVYNKTNPVRYKLVDVVLATGHSSGCSMVYLEFTAELLDKDCREYYEEGCQQVYRQQLLTGVDKPRTMRTYVSITPYYVEFVQRVPLAELL
ncbi:hypothetical protein ABFS83_06G066900 [Erythranthe nasuta]